MNFALQNEKLTSIKDCKLFTYGPNVILISHCYKIAIFLFISGQIISASEEFSLVIEILYAVLFLLFSDIKLNIYLLFTRLEYNFNGIHFHNYNLL